MTQNVIEELKAKYEAAEKSKSVANVAYQKISEARAESHLEGGTRKLWNAQDAHRHAEDDADDDKSALYEAMHRHLPALLDLARLATAVAPQLRAAEHVLYKRWLAANDDITHRAWADAQKIALGLEEALSRLNATDEGKTP